MSLLANMKHETFAQNRAGGMNQLDAYEAAGYPRNPSSASQLANKPEVRARIEELINERTDQIKRMGEEGMKPPGAADDDSNPDFKWVVTMLKKNVQLAQENGQIAPANKAVELLAQMFKFIGKEAKDHSAEKPAERPKPSITDLMNALKNVPADDGSAEGEAEEPAGE